jgi:uncharacterized membrane protein required for colicin V production
MNEKKILAFIVDFLKHFLNIFHVLKFFEKLFSFRQGPSITKKNDDFIFCLFWYAQQQNPYIYKQTRVFVLIFSMLLFCFY